MLESEQLRAIKLIREVVSKLDLNLTGLNVLTEVGSNNYLYTPLIAAIAGAENVYAWCNDSPYGLASDVKKQLDFVSSFLELNTPIVVKMNEQVVEHIRTANIITNSGSIRPIDKSFLKHVDPSSCVIPLMYEAWELRESDIDIVECQKKGVKVAGTWESHPELSIFE